jgi:two-component system LytT family response regulator
MSLKMKVLIVDDESLARDLVRNYLTGVEDVEIAGECSNGFEALKAIQDLQPDLLFLDIQMPKIDGFELLEVLDPRPEIIFCTAYDQYAIKAFEMNAIDYLLKPFSRERLLKAVEKAKERMGTPSQSSFEKLQQDIDDSPRLLERIVTRLGSKITVVPVDRIHYLEAADDYVMIHSDLGNHLKEKTMKYFEAHLPQDQFIRIHRSYIVNISEIKSLELYSKDSYLAVLKSGDKLKVSSEGYRRLRRNF